MKTIEQMLAMSKIHAVNERARTGDFHIARKNLQAARAYLAGLPRPWCNDCIFNSIELIDKALNELKGNQDD